MLLFLLDGCEEVPKSSMQNSMSVLFHSPSDKRSSRNHDFQTLLIPPPWHHESNWPALPSSACIETRRRHLLVGGSPCYWVAVVLAWIHISQCSGDGVVQSSSDEVVTNKSYKYSRGQSSSLFSRPFTSVVGATTSTTNLPSGELFGVFL